MKTKTSEIITIFGRKGSGKTTIALEYILKSKKEIVFVIDVNNEYNELLEKEKTVKVFNFESFDNLIKYYKEAFEKFIADVKNKDKKIIILIQNIETDSFDRISEFVYSFGDCLFVIEECSNFVSNKFLPESIQKLINQSRHREVDLIFISMRPYACHILIRSQSDILIAYKFSEKRDIDYIREKAPEYEPENLKIVATVKGKYKDLTIYEPFIYYE